MKYLLLSAVFSLNVEYADLTTCQTALEQVSKHDDKAICIPAGKEKSELMFEKFLGLIQKLDNQKTQ
jgi:hypothetical protein|tara:strand:- start:572 stop:772 length:201 start_codon:yes stop_codon:yes gene_type:complete